jgi:hypothetical protein
MLVCRRGGDQYGGGVGVSFLSRLVLVLDECEPSLAPP